MKDFLIGTAFVSTVTVLVSLLLIFISPLLFKVVVLVLGVLVIVSILSGMALTWHDYFKIKE